MKKQFSWFILIGALLIAFPLFAGSFYTLSSSVADFIKGLGSGVIIATFFLQLWHSKRMKQNRTHN